MKGCVISAPMTGSGKTTVTLGLLAALRKRGIAVQPLKIGPDFIVPSLHEIASGVLSHNLDGWMLTRDANESLFAGASGNVGHCPSRSVGETGSLYGVQQGSRTYVEGFVFPNGIASYIHLHFLSNPALARNMLNS